MGTNASKKQYVVIADLERAEKIANVTDSTSFSKISHRRSRKLLILPYPFMLNCHKVFPYQQAHNKDQTTTYLIKNG